MTIHNIDLKDLLQKSKIRAALVILLGVCLYMLGIELPLLLAVVVTLAIFLPMPAVFDSWFSRLFLGFFFLCSLVQVAAITQLYTYPGGKFPFMAILLAILTVGVVGVFGSTSHVKGLRIFKLKDAAVLLACGLFLLPFVSILRGDDSVQKIGEYAAVQVVDAVTHQSVIVGYSQTQTLRGDYKIGRYYPTGFHITTAFVEHSAIGDINNRSWATRATLYFMQYIFLGMLLCMILVYLGFSLLASFRPKSKDDPLSILSLALALGFATTIMHLWLFVDTGFLNYYYVCATALAAVCYLVSTRPEFNEQKNVRSNLLQFAWPLTAFLLLGFGSSCSWPLLAPVFLLSACLVLFPIKVTVLKKHLWPFAAVCIPIGIVAIMHIATVYMQTIYDKGNGNLILMAGALGNYNIFFLLIGLAVTGYVIIKNRTNVSNGLLAIIMPYVLLLCGLMALHYFKLGEARYYVIKASMILEMLLLALGVAYVVRTARDAGLNGLMRFVWTMGVALFVVIACIGTLPMPLHEVRSLFRKQSGADLPAYVEGDVRSISKLESANKLQSFNMTILHYDPTGGRFFADIEIAAWAQTVSKYGVDTGQTSGSIDVFTNRNQSCFSKQFWLLNQDVTTPEMKDELKKTVRTCAAIAAHNGLKYYVVTDPGSAQAVKAAFGDVVQVVY